MSEKETRYSFREKVVLVMQADHLPFVMALYKVLDEWTARAVENEPVKPACHRGCSFCCHQAVTCTDSEWEVIVDCISRLPEKQAYRFKKRSKRLLADWRRYWLQNYLSIRLGMKSPLLDWQGKPCLFLNDERTCDIYPVRPIDCRTMSSTIVCTQWKNQPGVQRMRFVWELEANNWILEGQNRKGRMEVHFLLERLDNLPFF